MAFESRYKGKYGDGLSVRKPDFERCCEEVSTPDGWRYHQCRRKNGHGPDGAYCKQHDPDVVAARRAKAKAKADAKNIEFSFQWRGKWFAKALKKIADGDNDPRTTAREALGDLYDKIETEG